MELNSASDALSGLQANQTYMDTVGNNIANVNTVGYKSQSVRFEDLLSQTLGYGTSATTTAEGNNPFQVGMGVGQGEMKTILNQGSVINTGRITDMAIQGNGYFIANNGQQNFYTRDGSFNVAPDGTLTTASGMSVQGWAPTTVNGNQTFVTSGGPSAVKIPLGSVNATATSAVSLTGNLDSTQAVYSTGTNPPTTASGGYTATTMTVYDSQGAAHVLNATFQKTANNTWQYTLSPQGSDISFINNTSLNATTGSTSVTGTMTFSSSGALVTDTSGATTLNPLTLSLGFADGATNGSVTVDMSHISQVAATSANYQVNVATADGSTSGSISTFSVGPDGSVTAIYSNGTTKKIAQIALATFRNPDGLVREGNNLYAQGSNSGIPQTGIGNQGMYGQIVTGQLEGSNVDLATQFANMIQAQEGFNANAKVITTTNNLMQSVIQIVP